jgi:hypothetical protein
VLTEILEALNISDVRRREPCEGIFDDLSPKYNKKAKYNAVNAIRFFKLNKIKNGRHN